MTDVAKEYGLSYRGLASYLKETVFPFRLVAIGALTRAGQKIKKPRLIVNKSGFFTDYMGSIEASQTKL